MAVLLTSVLHNEVQLFLPVMFLPPFQLKALSPLKFLDQPLVLTECIDSVEFLKAGGLFLLSTFVWQSYFYLNMVELVKPVVI